MQETQIQSLCQEDSPGEGNGNPLQYSCPENSLRQRSLAGTVCGITKNWMWVSMHSCTCTIELYSSKWNLNSIQFSSLMQSCPTLCDPMDCSTPGHPCPSPTPGLYSNSCPLSWWCHPTTSSSIIPFSSHLQSFPASGSFQKSQFFASGGQNFGVSASASVLPVNIQGWFPLGWTGWISLQSKGLPRVFSNTTLQKHHSLALSFLYSPALTSTHDYWENHSSD